MKKGIALLFLMLPLGVVMAQDALQKRLDSVMDAYEKLNWNAVMLVGKGDQIVYQRAIGYANIESQIPLQVDAIMQTASVGKMFTATRIMQLLAQNKIDLNTPIAKYFPDWKLKNLDRITIHHLLTHTSGLASQWDHPKYDFKKEYTNAELKMIMEEVPLVFAQPGEKASYSNIGYVLLGEIIAMMDKMSYEQAIKEFIFKPAGIQTVKKVTDAKQVATPYYQISSSKFAVDDEMLIKEIKPGSGAGGWMMNALSLYQFMNAYLKGVYLNETSRTQQLTANYTFNVLEKDFRYGVVPLNQNFQNPRLIFGHNGGGKGFSVDAYTDPTTGYIVVMCSNQYASSYAITTNVFRVLQDEAIRWPVAAATVRIIDHLYLKGNQYVIDQPQQFFEEIKLKPTEFLIYRLFEHLTIFKDYQAASAMANAGTTLFPNAVNLWMCKGDAALLLQQKEQAVAHYLMAKKLAEEQNKPYYVAQIEAKLSAI